MPARSPAALTVGDVRYTLARDAAVVPLDAVAAPGDALLVVEDEGVAVVEVSGHGRPPAALERPVYRSEPAGKLALPTGRVFLRCDEGDTAALHGDRFAGAGFVIDAVPGWAPHAAWLRAASGEPADALAGLEALRRLPGVAHVEPELLSARAPRGA